MAAQEQEAFGAEDDREQERDSPLLDADPNFAVVCSFLKLFGETVALEPIAVPKLAKHLLDTHDVPEQLLEIYTRLLRRAVRNFRLGCWEKCLIKFCHQRGHRQEAWELERFGYKKSSIHVKIKILKCLLEYQFVCNNKFKTAVNKMENRTLRLNPIGRDNKGRCYWMHRDHRANIRLYREDQDEETWKLIASDRAGVVDVIAALKSGKSPTNSPTTEPVLNEDSNSVASPCNPILYGDIDAISKNGSSSSSDKKVNDDSKVKSSTTTTEKSNMDIDQVSSSENSIPYKSDLEAKEKSEPKTKKTKDESSRITTEQTTDMESDESCLDNQTESNDNDSPCDTSEKMESSNDQKDRSTKLRGDLVKSKKVESECEDDETIEENVMIVKGDGNGADCESIPTFYFSEEIEEEVMYITGEGSGYDCTTGNPSVESNSTRGDNQSDGKNDNENQGNKNNSEDSKSDINEISEKLNCVESIPKKNNVDETVNLQTSEQLSKSTDSTPDDTEQDFEAKNVNSAPLPVTKRFLQNIPKSTSKSDTSKTKLWSVDSMCRNASSSESPATDNKNSISVIGETVLLNANSLYEPDSDSKNIDKVSKDENHAASGNVNTTEGSGSVTCEDLNAKLNANCDNSISNSSKCKVSIFESANDCNAPKKFFFGQPGCLKLSPDSSKLTPSNALSNSKDASSKKEQKTDKTVEEDVQVKPNNENSKIEDVDSNKNTFLNSDKDSCESNDPVEEEKLETMPKSQVAASEIENNILSKPSVPVEEISVDNSSDTIEDLRKNISNDSTSTLTQDIDVNVMHVDSAVSPLVTGQHGKHKVDSESSHDAESAEPEISASKKFKLSDEAELKCDKNSLQEKPTFNKVNEVKSNNDDISINEDTKNPVETESNEKISLPSSVDSEMKNNEETASNEKVSLPSSVDSEMKNNEEMALNEKVSLPSSVDSEMKNNEETASNEKVSLPSSVDSEMKNNEETALNEKVSLPSSVDSEMKNNEETASNEKVSLPSSVDSEMKNNEETASNEKVSRSVDSEMKNNEETASNEKVSLPSSVDSEMKNNEETASDEKVSLQSSVDSEMKNNEETASNKKVPMPSSVDSEMKNIEETEPNEKVSLLMTSEDVKNEQNKSNIPTPTDSEKGSESDQNTFPPTDSIMKNKEETESMENMKTEEETESNGNVSPSPSSDCDMMNEEEPEANENTENTILTDNDVKNKVENECNEFLLPVTTDSNLRSKDEIKSNESSLPPTVDNDVKIKAETESNKNFLSTTKKEDIKDTVETESNENALSLVKREEISKIDDKNSNKFAIEDLSKNKVVLEKKSVLPKKVEPVENVDMISDTEETTKITSVSKGTKRRVTRASSPKKSCNSAEVSSESKKLANCVFKADPIGNSVKIELNDSKEEALPLKKEKKSNTRKRVREESGSPISDEEHINNNKKLKFKQKKTNISQRKKVEEKKVIDSSSDEETEITPPKRGNRNVKKNLKNDAKTESKKVGPKKKRNTKAKAKAAAEVETPPADDFPPVRQSRRIAQLKIKEEAQRRMMEEVALRELKAQHKKKNNKEKNDQDWKKQSSDEHSSDNVVVKLKGKVKKKDKNWQKSSLKWNSSSGGNDTDSEPGDEPEDEFDDPDLDYNRIELKSDHEFSPESDVEEDETVPVRRARTLKKDDDDGAVDGGCVYCGKPDHPEWILLCDSCDAGWHASCLKPVLFLIPEGEWFCPPCNHKSLINALEEQLEEYDVHVKNVEIEDLNRKVISNESVEKVGGSDSEFDESGDKSDKSDNSEGSGSTGSSSNSSDDEKIYRLRERRQLPISYRFKEYDQLISSAIKEEYKEDDNSSAGNQGRGKDISTIIEAEKEEKKALLQAAGENEKDIAANMRKIAARARRRPRKLNSLEVLSDDADDNSDEDFKETGWSSSSSEAISSDANGSSSSHSSDSMPLRRTLRQSKPVKSRRRIIESPELKKRNRICSDESESEDSGEKEWPAKKKKSSRNSNRNASKKKKRSKSKRNNIDKGEAGDTKTKVKIKYGGLSESSNGSHDWSPAHRTRQRKYNYMEMPNTESEEEAHKPSGKHMDSSDEYKGESDSCSDSDSSRDRNKRKLKVVDEDSRDSYEKRMNASTVSDILKGSLVPIVKLSDISPKKSENSLQKDESEDVKDATLLDSTKSENENNLLDDSAPDTSGSIKNIPLTPVQIEREKKRKEKEEKLLEKEKRKEERIKKKEEKQQIKEQKAKEREEKKNARLASKEQNKTFIGGLTGNLAVPIPIMNNMPRNMPPAGAHVPMGFPPGALDNHGPPFRSINAMNMKFEPSGQLGPAALQEFGHQGSSPILQDQILNYRAQLGNISPHVRHSESPGSNSMTSLPDERKEMPIDHRIPPSIIPGQIRPNFIGQRILHPEVEGSPNRILPPGFGSGPLQPEDLHGRPPISGPSPVGSILGNPHRSEMPITDLSMGSSGLARHLSPNLLGVSPVLEGSPSHMPGPRGSTPKRRGRGPGKKTLARQAAAAAVPNASNLNVSERDSPGSISSNSPLPEGTLTVAGAPQPFRPNVDPPSIITRMPHMMPPPYRGSSMFSNTNAIYGPPRGAPPNVTMGGAYRAHPPHPLDPSPSGGGPISMASPGRLSPHGPHPYPSYPSPSYYPPASTPPQIVPHGSPYPPPHARFPSPHVQPAPQSISPASTSTQDSIEMDDKSKVFQEPSSEQGPFLKSEIKQEPEPVLIKQSTSPTEELEESATSEEPADKLEEPQPNVTSAIPPSTRVHPQIKHTESKGGGGGASRGRISVTAAARYPQGPYAPQFGPYAPYLPPASDVPYMHSPMHVLHPNLQNASQLLTPIHRPSHPPSHLTSVQIPQRASLMPVEILRPPDAAAGAAVLQNSSPSTAAGTVLHNEEETGEFGGLVSYFSSQQEDDIDT